MADEHQTPADPAFPAIGREADAEFAELIKGVGFDVATVSSFTLAGIEPAQSQPPVPPVATPAIQTPIAEVPPTPIDGA